MQVILSLILISKDKITAASFFRSSSEAPREANPISWENWANLGSANKGMWPKISWQQSLKVD